MENRQRIESLMRAVFCELQEEGDAGLVGKRDEFAFHMTDWLDDLEKFVALLQSETISAEAAAQQIVGFLYHVTGHLNAACRLVLGEVPDPFGSRQSATLDEKRGK